MWQRITDFAATSARRRVRSVFSRLLPRSIVSTDARLKKRDRKILLAIAQVAIPSGQVVPKPDEKTLERFEHHFGQLSPRARAALRATWWTLEYSPVPRTGRWLSKLSRKRRLRALQRWNRGHVTKRWALRGLLTPLKMAHFDRPSLFEAMSCRYDVETPTQKTKARWHQNIVETPEVNSDLEIQADVVVVGTGAGGAVVAKELAELGHAVAMVEAGSYFDRHDFDGRTFNAMSKMYYGRGSTFTVGNTPIMIPSGKTVGGTTTVNSGTCFRTPNQVLIKWVRDYGLREFSPDLMAPHFEKVEHVLRVEPAKWKHLGGCARVIKQGCDALGYQGHGPLKRNAPDCEGYGWCCFGCPSDAKRSTNVSYVPLALQNNANLFTGAKVTRILVDQGRACGVEAEAYARPDASHRTRRLTINAKVVVVACGAYWTPTLLLQNDLANSSRQLGRNLSLHPAAGMIAEFDEAINGWDAIPQGYYIDEFADRRIMFEGAFVPLDMFTSAYGGFGRELTRLMERYNHLAMFGVMVKDSSRGRVRLSPTGKPWITYNVNRADTKALKEGLVRLAEIFFAAGAETLYPSVHGFEKLNGFRDLERFRRAKIRATDLTLSGYHALGTARMGSNPTRSVVGPNHETHDIPNLFIVDASSVPSPLGVNPQVTIMAMATRAAEQITKKLD